MGEAISCGAGFGGTWFESGHPRNLTIRGNTFLDCGYANPNGAEVIRFRTADSPDPVVFDKVVIEGNIFRTFDPMILRAVRIGELTFRNNCIEKSDTYPVLNPDKPVISITESAKIILEDNTFDTPFENKLEIDDSSRANLSIHRNAGLDGTQLKQGL